MKLRLSEDSNFIEAGSGKIKKDNQINDYPVDKLKHE